MSLSDRLSALQIPLSTGLLVGTQPSWVRDLWQCLPARLRTWLAARRPRRVIEASTGQAQVMRDLGGQREPIGVLDPAVQISCLPDDNSRRGRPAWVETVLELPDEAILRRSLILPVQVRDRLRTVMTYELDRITPFARDTVYFDAQISDERVGAGKLVVDVAVCRRDQASAWLDYLRAAGAPADCLRWPSAWHGANLLAPQERPRRRHAGLLLNGLLAALLFALLAALMVSPLWQKQQAHRMLERELRELRVQAAEVTRVADELEQARIGSVAVLQRKADAPRMTDLLRELTDLLPDGTWVQTLNYREGEVDIRGESTQATALIAVLENGPGISSVSFRSPVMQVATTGSERFHIAFTYQRPAP
ncbi:MAG: PilN domain-containing protein [Chromatiaceae bacterium]|nr:PilN domain-containing protein [Chromatiaceae bacterium]MCF8002597.1 PilN domain-containing protein [Chromatiaceae bacterium]